MQIFVKFKFNLLIKAKINLQNSLHQNISFKRAFNPILGETYEGFFTVDEDELERDWNIGRGLSINFDIKQPKNKSEDSQNWESQNSNDESDRQNSKSQDSDSQNSDDESDNHSNNGSDSSVPQVSKLLSNLVIMLSSISWS